MGSLLSNKGRNVVAPKSSPLSLAQKHKVDSHFMDQKSQQVYDVYSLDCFVWFSHCFFLDSNNTFHQMRICSHQFNLILSLQGQEEKQRTFNEIQI